jgi:hypothetical protein
MILLQTPDSGLEISDALEHAWALETVGSCVADREDQESSCAGKGQPPEPLTAAALPAQAPVRHLPAAFFIAQPSEFTCWNRHRMLLRGTPASTGSDP